MIFNRVMAVILCYFSELGSFWGQLAYIVINVVEVRPTFSAANVAKGFSFRLYMIHDCGLTTLS